MMIDNQRKLSRDIQMIQMMMNIQLIESHFTLSKTVHFSLICFGVYGSSRDTQPVIRFNLFEMTVCELLDAMQYFQLSYSFLVPGKLP